MKDPRPEPPEVNEDPNSVEVASIWIAKNGLRCSLKIGMYEESNVDECKAWGIILSDVCRHVSRGMSSFYGGEEASYAQRILKSFASEISDPTSCIHGNISDK